MEENGQASAFNHGVESMPFTVKLQCPCFVFLSLSESIWLKCIYTPAERSISITPSL